MASTAEVVPPPALSVAQMREVDRLMVEELNIGLVQMMENAGRHLATHARRWLPGGATAGSVVVLAGRGGNGGGGLAAARRLWVWGARVSVLLAAPPEEFDGVPARQLDIVTRLGLPCHPPGTLEASRLLGAADVVLDALIGYSLQGAVREPVAGLVAAANRCERPVVSLDLPSGLSGDTGEAGPATVRARSTLTLALPKVGLLAPGARAWVGELFLADISVPASVYQRLGLRVGPIFARDDIVAVPTATVEPAGASPSSATQTSDR